MSTVWGFSVWAHNANYIPIQLADGRWQLAVVEGTQVRLIEGSIHASRQAAINAALSGEGGAIVRNIGTLTEQQIERILGAQAAGAAGGTAGGRAGGVLIREVAGSAATQAEKAAALEAGAGLINARFGEGSFTLTRVQNPNGGWILFEGRAQAGGVPSPVIAIHPNGRVFIERIAVRHVTELLEAEGWLVQSVENENRGFDLIARKPHPEDPQTAIDVRFVEVKGRAGVGK